MLARVTEAAEIPNTEVTSDRKVPLLEAGGGNRRTVCLPPPIPASAPSPVPAFIRVLIPTFILSTAVLSTFIAFAQTPIALVPVETGKDGGVKVSGAIEVSNGNAIITNSGVITAGDRTATISLPGKGELRLCSTTMVHLSRDRSVPNPATPPPTDSAAATAPHNPAAPAPATPAPATPVLASSGSAAIMIALDRGALEASYTTGKYSDVLMTPDFRILISGPGQADLRIRVSPQGDTCVENRGDHAPYVTVSSQLEEGLYRVQPGQRVLFEHGSLHEVVDHESEPCGCPPPPQSIASSGPGSTATVDAKAALGASVPGDGSKPADSTFPLAQSEGLAPLTPPTQPAARPGEVHTQVTVPFIYNGAAPPVVPASRAPASGVPASGVKATPSNAAKQPGNSVNPSNPATRPVATAKAPPPARPNGIFHRLCRFFSKIFGS